jgi:hypothetical protein
VQDDAQEKILKLLDVIVVEVAASRNETAALRTEMRSGFDRLDRRLENLETRVEKRLL